MSQAVAQIGHTLSTAGMGSAQGLNPYPKAKKDMPFMLREDGSLVHRVTGQVVRHHKGRKYGR